MPSPFLKAAQNAIRAATAVGATEVWTITRTASTYDPSTRDNTETETDYTWTVVVEDYREGLVDGSTVKAGDRKIIGAAADLDIDPDPTKDHATDPDGLDYTIVPSGLRRDPASATWQLQVRR